MKELSEMTPVERAQECYTAFETVVCGLATINLACDVMSLHEREALVRARNIIGDLFLVVHDRYMKDKTEVVTILGRSILTGKPRGES